MLQQIHIQNFRCFEDFKAEGFERINLIGGKNNSGKSCLLEGIGMMGIGFDIQDLIELRGVNQPTFKNIKNENGNTFIEIGIIHPDDIKVIIKKNLSFKNVSWHGHKSLDLTLIQQETELPKIDILKSFDEFDTNLVKHKLIQILSSLDNRIEDIRTFKTKEGLWIKKFNEVYQPLNFFGDATKKILKYFTPFFEKLLSTKQYVIKNYSYLLIDEIENGIHYTAHKEFWQHLFKLCKELNVQVFATTHSLEMIKAFNEVALKEGEGAYFEMMRDEKTNNIEILKHSPQVLEEELELKVPKFRGEEYKTSINLATDLMETLNQASAAAQEKLKANGLAIPYIEDGWIWQLMPNGEKEKIEKLEAIK